MDGISLFSSSGIGETYLEEEGIQIRVSNELIPRRANLYKHFHPNTHVVTGDISNKEVFNEIIKESEKYDIDFLLASPPCQGISIAGKNRNIDQMKNDERNYLILHVVEAIRKLKPKYVILENVPALLKLHLLIDDKLISVLELLEIKFGHEYNIESKILDTVHFETPQTRRRAIIKMNLKGLEWDWPNEDNKVITVKEAIGDLPSLESGEYSDHPWHYGRIHTPEQIEWMRHTPTGQTAFDNPVYFPKKKDGTPIKGYNTSYRRICWNEPAPTITIRNDAISSQRNVHPGRELADGTYSDARVLSILELMRLTGLPDDWPIPIDTPEILVRQIIGECIPPKLIKALVKGIRK